MNTKLQSEECTDQSLWMGMMLLRLWLAVRALQTGIEKFAGFKTERRPLLDEFGNPDVSGAMYEAKMKFYSWANYHGIPETYARAFGDEPFMPAWMMKLYGASLGPLLLLTGFALLIGAGTRISLFVMGLVYISLTWGLILLGQDGGIAWLGIHILLIVAALGLARYNRWTVTKKW